MEGFYDDVSSPTPEQEQNILNHAPLSFQHFQKKLGVQKLLADTPRNVLLKQWFQPSMTIHGITTTPKIQTQSPSFIANSVEGYISIRTVPCQNPEKLIQLVTQHLNKEILKYAQVMAYQMEVSVNKKGDWWVVRTETPFFKALSEATKECWETSPMMVREGGTIPIVSYLEKVLHTQALILPMGQASDAAHLKNERFRLENFYKGKDVIKTFIKNINHHQ
uniref:Uncharacterized protein n=1 Tax=Arcella intermedia TaxID=1963864 RepID=A0A6B2LGX0_9EUKA